MNEFAYRQICGRVKFEHAGAIRFLAMREIETRARLSYIDGLIAQVFDIPLNELSAATRRSARTAFSRQVAMYLAHVVCELTPTQIGEHYGRDRTTVAHACRRVEDRRDDPHLDVSQDFLESALRGWIGRHVSGEAA
ncbi:MAG: helix-turn-helix domain-containing protein [Hyphomicrobiales bacterium]